LGTEAGAREDAALPRDAYTLLAQANLYRMRGQWDDAAEKCMAALRLAPDSASANSLLGDIYENQGRYDDAAQWYRMALDANPDSPADRLKLDRLRRHEAALHNAASSPRALQSETPAKKSSPGLLHRMPRDPELALRLAATFAALGLVFVVLCAYRLVHPGRSLRALGLGGDAVVSSKPVVVPPVAGTLPADPDGTPAHDPSEAALLAALQGAQDLSRQGIAVYDVQVDPRVSRMTVTFAVPMAPGMTQAEVSQDALHVLQDAAAGQAADTFTARCFLVVPSGGASVSGAMLGFVGDASRQALQAPAAPGPPADAAAAFTNTWWSATADIRA
jgi:tetratricopeptide (TPR) repeat protein